jgi:hypothetical protein
VKERGEEERERGIGEKGGIRRIGKGGGYEREEIKRCKWREE